GGGRTRGRSGDQGNGRIDGQGGQVGGQSSEVNDGVNGVPDFSTIIAQQLQNLLPTIKTQLGDQACNPKEYDGKGCAIMYTCWIEKMESVQDMSGCKDSQKVKYTAGSFVCKDLMWWNSQICTRGQEAAIGMYWEDFKTLTREEFCPINEMQKLETKLWNHAMTRAGHAAYTNRFHKLARLVPHLVSPEGKRIESNRSIKKNHEKRGNRREPRKNRNEREDKKRTRTGNAFATTANPIRRETTGAVSKCTTCNTHHPPEAPCHVESGLEARGNHQNQVMVINKGQGRGNQGNHARGRAFMLGAEEARQDPNIVTDIEPSELGFSYEIEIASRQLVEIDKVIKSCKLEIEGHVFDINLIPFGSGSFDVIIGMDLLSDHKAEIICHEKVVSIPLLDGKVLRALEEKPKEKVRQLTSARTKEQKQEEIIVVKDFPETQEEHEMHIGLVLELVKKEKIPSKIEAVKNWKAPRTPSEGEEQENAFQTLKDKLYNAPVLALPDGPKDFVVYYDTSGLGLGCVLMQRGW
nr:hypothetical protein [Tanacetum cinerariifolium]